MDGGFDGPAQQQLQACVHTYLCPRDSESRVHENSQTTHISASVHTAARTPELARPVKQHHDGHQTCSMHARTSRPTALQWNAHVERSRGTLTRNASKHLLQGRPYAFSPPKLQGHVVLDEKAREACLPRRPRAKKSSLERRHTSYR